MTSGKSFQLKEGRSRLKIRKKFFIVKVLRHWHTLPGEAVDAPYLGFHQGQVGLGFEQPGLVRVPCNPNHSRILWLKVFSIQKNAVILWCFVISCEESLWAQLVLYSLSSFWGCTGQTHHVTTVTPFSLHKCCFRSVSNVLLWWACLFVLMCLVHDCSSEKE